MPGFSTVSVGIHNDAYHEGNGSVVTHAALSYHMPSGAILMWHGLIANIPGGYVLCNGANSTPDLRSKFLRGAPDATEAGGTGGADTHTLVTAEMPAHTHSASVLRNATGGGSDTINAGAGAGGGTNVGVSVATVGSGAAHNNMPAYYQILFIMKT